MYTRILTEKIRKSFKNGFVTIVYGARRVGKTILLDQIASLFPDNPILYFNGDTQEARQALETTSEIKLSQLVKNHEIIFVDEAQNVRDIGKAIKIIIDLFPEKKIILTGSSSLALAHGASENLVGRNQSHILYPLSTEELTQDFEEYKKTSLLDQQLVFGGYPYIYHLSMVEEKKKYLLDIVEDYLFKDVMLLGTIESPDVFKKIAVMLAYQIGNEVSLNELARATGSSVKTVSRYLDLLEKTFVIFHLDAYSTNQRNEITKSKKYYFYDLGIRNALIGQFQPIETRSDIGALWENFVIVERMKKSAYAGKIVNRYFWRTYQGAEVDLVEVVDGAITAYECKWNKSLSKTPKAFLETYNTEIQIITKDNYLGML